MRKILFSACCDTYMHYKACEGLVKLLKDGRFQVDSVGDVRKEEWSLYNLIIAFNKRGYEKIRSLHPGIPVIYAILADDYDKENIEDRTLYEHLLVIAPKKTDCYGDSVTLMHFPCLDKVERGFVSRYSKPAIVVGMDNERSVLRVFILLNTMAHYRVNIVYTGEQDLYGIGYASHVTVREDFETDTLVDNSNLVIGSKYIALQGALQKRPVVIVGDYGSGGVLTSQNVIEQFYNRFEGRIGGEYSEYFPLEDFQKDVCTAMKLPSRELEKISELVKKEMTENGKKVWEVVASYLVEQK